MSSPSTISAAPQPSRGSIAVWGAVVFILAAHWIAGFSATLDKSLAYDEGAHLFSGVNYWLRGDFRFQCENGNLPQRWCAIPAILGGQTRLPDAQLPFWKDAQPREGGNAYLYDSGNDPTWTIRAGRGMCGLWGVLICLAVFLWSRKLFGTSGALVSLISCAACPTLLANAPLMTSDACLTLFLLVAVATIWNVLHRMSHGSVSLAALALSGLFLAKTSAILIFPMAAILIVIRLRSGKPLVMQWIRQKREVAARPQQLAAICGASLVCGVVAWSAVWAAYDFRFAPTANTSESTAEYLRFGSLERVTEELSTNKANLIRCLANSKLLPEAYLYGAAYVAAHSERIAFLNGEYSLSGFRGYFPYTFLVKTPLGMLGLIAAAIAVGWPSQAVLFGQRKDGLGRPSYELAPLLTLIGVYLAAAIFSGLNIGHRHLLPIYPAIHILIGAASWWLGRNWAGRSVIATLAFGLVIETALAWPNYLAYFNPIVPPGTAHTHIVESSLDWGQDLPGLSRWLRENNSGSEVEPVFLAYFGVDRPEAYDIHAVRIPEESGTNTRVDGQAGSLPHGPLPLTAGIYCISATTLQGVYTPRPGPWSKKHEEAYLQLKEQLSKSSTPDQIRSLERARFLRLLAFLRHQEPVANIGGSILIFRVSDADIQTALEGSPAELAPLPLMEQLKAMQHLKGR